MERVGIGFAGRRQLNSSGKVWLLKTQCRVRAPGHFNGSALFPGSLVHLTGLGSCLDPHPTSAFPSGDQKASWSAPLCVLKPCLLPGLSPTCWGPSPDHPLPIYLPELGGACVSLTCGTSAGLAACPAVVSCPSLPRPRPFPPATCLVLSLSPAFCPKSHSPLNPHSREVTGHVFAATEVSLLQAFILAPLPRASQ